MYQMVCELCGGICSRSKLSHENDHKLEGVTFRWQLFISCRDSIPHICDECLDRIDEAIKNAIEAPGKGVSKT